MNIDHIKLYHYPATRSSRVKWLLHELYDDSFEVEVLELYEGAQYDAEFLTKNPNHNVPVLELTLGNGDTRHMLESGAMISLLADINPQKKLAPLATTFSVERADYLQMLHFAASSWDMMLWQIRVHKHVLSGAEKDEKTVKRYMNKIRQEVEPQLLARLSQHAHICGPDFSAVDCLVGHNILWSRSYGLCQDALFDDYLSRVSKRPAFLSAFADAHKFVPVPPENAALSQKFTG
ncbi:MAG: glutathione S-transferase family protein [Halioglobus sp.]